MPGRFPRQCFLLGGSPIDFCRRQLGERLSAVRRHGVRPAVSDYHFPIELTGGEALSSFAAAVDVSRTVMLSFSMLEIWTLCRVIMTHNALC
jgi:hypothetical protein